MAEPESLVPQHPARQVNPRLRGSTFAGRITRESRLRIPGTRRRRYLSDRSRIRRGGRVHGRGNKRDNARDLWHKYGRLSPWVWVPGRRDSLGTKGAFPLCPAGSGVFGFGAQESAHRRRTWASTGVGSTWHDHSCFQGGRAAQVGREKVANSLGRPVKTAYPLSSSDLR